MDASGKARDSGPRDVASLGELTLDKLREQFPGWRISQVSESEWWAVRAGEQAWDGPGSLLKRSLGAGSIEALAERLLAQEWLDSLSPDQLAEVYAERPAASGR